MPDAPALPINCTTREAGLIAVGELTVTRRLPTANVGRIAPGSLLWVREPFCLPKTATGLSPLQYVDRPELACCAAVRIHFAADGPAPAWAGATRFARSMPRALSRLLLTVTSVRREPLRSITDEGLQQSCFPGRQSFVDAWDDTVRKGVQTSDADLWAANPEVAVIEFTAERGNIADREFLQAALA